MECYCGARILQGEQVVSPPVLCQKGILAAPLIAKLVLAPVLGVSSGLPSCQHGCMD